MTNSTKVQSKTIKTTLFITYTAILIALAIICNTFDIPIGTGSLKLTFSYIPCFIAGIFLGPIAGFLVGFLGDLLGFLINSQGMTWIPLLTISSAFIGFIPGLIFKIKKLNIYLKFALSFLFVFLFCTCFLTTLGLYLFYAKGKKTFWVYLIGRIGPQLGFFLINCVIICTIYYPLKKLVFNRLGTKTATNQDIENLEKEGVTAKNNENTKSHNVFCMIKEKFTKKNKCQNAECVQNSDNNCNTQITSMDGNTGKEDIR